MKGEPLTADLAAWRERRRLQMKAVNRARYLRDPEAMKAKSRAYKAAHPERTKKHAETRRSRLTPADIRRYNLKRYGLTPEAVAALREAQNGACAVCGAVLVEGRGKDAMCVDHDHKTGRLRALLCGACNRGLGQFSDDATKLEAAARYIRRHS
jgi:hypothetical protein